MNNGVQAINQFIFPFQDRIHDTKVRYRQVLVQIGGGEW